MKKIRVGVVRGGPSEEYEVSLKTGSTVLQNLDPDSYELLDILIDKNGVWHMHGVPITPDELASEVDVVFNALHGTYGEDGQIQHVFEQAGIPYTGSGVSGSMIAMHKPSAKEIFVENDIKTPQYYIVDLTRDVMKQAHDLFRTIAPPYILKPPSSGSSYGIRLASSFNELVEVLHEMYGRMPTLLVEEHVQGKEVTCGVVEGLRGDDYYVPPPVEICVPSEKTHFDYDAKYVEDTRHVCPAGVTKEEQDIIQKWAQDVHKHLGLKHYSRTDFIVSPRGIYTLEVNTLPGLTETSLLPDSLTSVGVTLPEFLEHLIEIALKDK